MVSWICDEFEDLGRYEIEGPEETYTGRAFYRDNKIFFKEDGFGERRKAKSWELEQITYRG